MKKIYPVLKNKFASAIVLFILTTTAFAQTDVLVCGAASPQSWLDDVQNKLVATGNFNSVTTYNLYLTGTPTLAYLQGFDAVLVYTDYGCQDAITFGNNLAAYIDGGGGVVNCVFSNAGVLIGGNFNTSPYQVVVPAGNIYNPTLTLGTILNSCHPIIQGITNFNGGSSSYRSTSDSLAPGAAFVANWNNGDWLVAEKQNVGPMNVRRADLNFYPPSSDARSDFWDSSTQGGQLMANALLWVAGVINPGPPPIAPMAITGSGSMCVGSITTYSISAVAAATSYTWTVPAGSTIQSGQGTTSITVLNGNTSGTVSVTADNGCGSSAPSTYTLTIYPLPTVAANATTVEICSGSPVTLSGSGASTYSWTGPVSDNVAFTPTVTDTYTVTGTDTNGCQDTDTITVVVNPLPVVIANSSASTVCSGAQIILNGSGDSASYTWSNAVTDNVPFNATVTSVFIVTGTDTNGCANTDSITVIVNALPPVVANSTASAVCTGDSVTLTGSGATTYTWSGSVVDGASFIPAATGTYTVTGTGLNGCVNTDTITVTVNTIPTVIANSTDSSVCAGSPVTLTGSGAAFYTWTNSVTNGSAFVPASTITYTVTGTDVNNCVNTDTITVTVNTIPAVTGTSSVSTICFDDANATLNGSPAGGIWFGVGVVGTSFDPSIAGNGTWNLPYNYTDANGCSASASVTITVSACVGVVENLLEDGVNVYPNPNNGEFTIAVNATIGDVKIEILDMQGRVVYVSQESNVTAGFTNVVSLDGMSNGIYMVRLTSANAQRMIKVSVEK